MKNKNVDIYCFSGTGNTYLTSRKIAEMLMIEAGLPVSIKDLAKTNAKSINLSHVIGIGFTVACWNTFPIVKDFISNLPNGNGAEAFVFTTMGDSSLNTAGNFGCILKNKGYNVIGTRGFLMPNNFIAVQKKEKNIVKIKKAYGKIEVFAKQLIDGTAKICKTNLFFRFSFAITNFVTNLWRGKLFQKIVRFKIDKNLCTKCGLCVKICPVGNIEHIESYPSFRGMRCQLCMRCISYCPSQSIKSFLLSKTYRALTSEEMRKWFN